MLNEGLFYGLWGKGMRLGHVAWHIKQNLSRARRVLGPRKKLAAMESIEKYVFIVTYGRSGSTLLQTIVNSLPGSQIHGENMGVPFKLALAYKNAKIMTAEHTGPRSRDSVWPWYGADNMNVEKLGWNCAQIVYDNCLAPPESTRISGFKAIRWQTEGNDLVASLDFLADHFKPSYFLFNIRNAEATSISGEWNDMPKKVAMDDITRMRNELIEIAAQRADALLLDFDKYTKQPDTLKQMFAFLEEPYNAAIIDTVLSRKLTHTGV